ncbi:LacI family DNA-binding transcriptional regulator [Actinomadura fibrosa]|uniref:LacI family DNA-binding transcriptional regulator n=1 Tax=Actinomadura fibrosa TaxID=111802 RepID=A0ABW2XFF2_9ACTN|nr:LacI family DNA-binding transcriptional regulator [Actinomadura fibrosa]
MPATSRPTSRDVAQEAGVSQSTVSLVLGGKWAGRVSPATARGVREAAERLGYRPNQAARNLRLGTTRTVMLMVPTLTAPFFGPVYTGAARVAAGHGFGVVVHVWPDDAGPADSPFAAPHEAIDGILASSMAVDALAGFRGTPAVMLDSDPAGPAPTVEFGVADGMRDLVAHLAGLGHRRFGHVAAAVDQWTFRVRAEALAAAVAALPGGVLARSECAIEATSAREAAARLLARPDPPTALVCDDDLLAAGAYKAARALGLDVPGDLSVTGFDDVLLATALEPELTTVRLPAEELGARGMTALLELLGGGRPRRCVLPGRLVVRGSTGPPRIVL